VPKIIQICVSGNTGSIGRFAEMIGNRAINSGWDSYIAYARNTRKSSSKIIKIGNFADIIFHGILTRIFDLHGLGSKIATKNLIKRIKEIQPNIIHLHNLHGYYLNFPILFKYLSIANIPVVWTLHDCWSFTGHCAHFDNIGCSKWTSICNNCPQSNSYPSSYFLDNSSRNYLLKKRYFNSIKNLKIITVSKWLDNKIKYSFLQNIKPELIYNGINLDLFRPNVTNKAIYNIELKNHFIILGVANPWSENKGFNDFIKLSTLLPSSIKIILVGLDQKQIDKLPSNILGLKKTDNQIELINLYNVADLFINFSSEESFGLTTAEALACGTPVLVYNATASPELIDSETGFVVEKGDYDKVLTCIELVKLNGKKFYIEKCRKRAIDLFNLNDTLNNYFKLYSNLNDNQLNKQQINI